MIRKIFLVGLVIVMALGAVALGRYPRPRRAGQSAYLLPAGNKLIDLADIKEDTLLPATAAPPAPDFVAGTWINSEPVKLDQLRGRVVLVEFWTFDCYNCRNTLPTVKDWDLKYRERGLTIIGVHTPETDGEYVLDNVRREVSNLGIKYPVVTDNDYKTWKAYNVQAWPTIFVLDKQGRARWMHLGEGRYDETEGVIKKLLAE